MGNDTLVEDTTRTAAEIARHVPLGAEAKRLLGESPVAREYFDLLLRKNLFEDAVRFLAHAMPKRAAVWWALHCARKAAGANPPAPVAAALRAVERWTADPSEENRRATWTAAEQASLATPAGSAAMAAFLSGGSLVPPNVPAVPPGEHLTARGVMGAIMLAAVTTEPAKAPEKYRQFLAQGIELANGADCWKANGSPAVLTPKR